MDRGGSSHFCSAVKKADETEESEDWKECTFSY